MGNWNKRRTFMLIIRGFQDDAEEKVCNFLLEGNLMLCIFFFVVVVVVFVVVVVKEVQFLWMSKILKN